MSQLTRRGFTGGLAAATLYQRVAAVEDQPMSPRIDCHLHCFAGPDDARFPYHPRAPYQPEQPATPEHLLRCMREGGVAAAVVVHPEPYQDDHRYLQHCLAMAPGRLKGTALVFADRPGSLERLPQLASQMDLVAVRVHAYAPDRLPPFGTPALRRLWTMAGELGLAVQLHFEPRYAPGFEPLIKAFPETPVIIDHLGRPLQGTPQEYRVVLQWAELPNTVIKLSALPETSTYPHRDVRPIVRQVCDAYGAERMIYGGGFNAAATPASYAAAFARAEQLIEHLPAADRAKILGGNAARLFGFQVD